MLVVIKLPIAVMGHYFVLRATQRRPRFAGR